MRVYGRDVGAISQLAERLADVDVGLRWGGPKVPGAINGEVTLLNATNQLTVLESNDIKVPEWCDFYSGALINPNTEESMDLDQGPDLWLARKQNHTQGQDIIPVGAKVKGRRRWQNSDFFVKYIPNVVREWRFHIFKGASIARGVKVWAGDGPMPITHPIIRSRRLGWHLRHDVDPPKGIRIVAKAAVEAVEYDLGAVDILELDDKSFVVLEVNSRPAIRDEYTLDAYERSIRAYAL